MITHCNKPNPNPGTAPGVTPNHKTMDFTHGFSRYPRKDGSPGDARNQDEICKWLQACQEHPDQLVTWAKKQTRPDELLSWYADCIYYYEDAALLLKELNRTFYLILDHSGTIFDTFLERLHDFRAPTPWYLLALLSVKYPAAFTEKVITWFLDQAENDPIVAITVYMKWREMNPIVTVRDDRFVILLEQHLEHHRGNSDLRLCKILSKLSRIVPDFWLVSRALGDWIEGQLFAFCEEDDDTIERFLFHYYHGLMYPYITKQCETLLLIHPVLYDLTVRTGKGTRNFYYLYLSLIVDNRFDVEDEYYREIIRLSRPGQAEDAMMIEVMNYSIQRCLRPVTIPGVALTLAKGSGNPLYLDALNSFAYSLHPGDVIDDLPSIAGCLQGDAHASSYLYIIARMFQCGPVPVDLIRIMDRMALLAVQSCWKTPEDVLRVLDAFAIMEWKSHPRVIAPSGFPIIENYFLVMRKHREITLDGIWEKYFLLVLNWSCNEREAGRTVQSGLLDSFIEVYYRFWTEDREESLMELSCTSLSMVLTIVNAIPRKLTFLVDTITQKITDLEWTRKLTRNLAGAIMRVHKFELEDDSRSCVNE